MSRSAKMGLVIAGYAAAIVAAGVAAQLYDARVATLPYDASGGMYAGGQWITSVAAFLVVALVPTLLALWFLRGHEGFWNGVGVVSIAFAAAGLVAALLFRMGAGQGVLALLSLLGLAQLLGVPLWAGAFVLFAWLAPTPATRRKMMIAVGIELVIGLVALVHWFVPRAQI